MNLKKNNIKAAFQDDRGAIFDILDKENISHVGMLISRKGSIRGNHYHKSAKQITYILSGMMELTIKDMRAENSEPQKILMEKGDMVEIPAMVAHTLEALEDTTFLIFTDRQRADGGYEDDTHRINIR
jgi:dTDP-4-dehydrorhamnose 3,5-epimerase-like enzyme